MKNLRAPILLISFLFFLCVDGFSFAADEVNADRIAQLYQTQQVAEADRLLNVYQEKNPQAERLCQLWLLAAEAERPFFEARTRLRQTADRRKAKPEGERALLKLAQLLHLSGQDRPALIACDEFIESHATSPRLADTLLLRGAVELRLPVGSTTSDSYARFLERFPNDPRASIALAGMADTKLRQGDWQGAEEAYRRALEGDAGSLDLPQIYFQLGQAAERQGKKEMARAYYLELIRHWSDTLVAAQAKDRLDSTMGLRGPVVEGPPSVQQEKYTVTVGLYAGLREAEEAAKKFTEAGMRIRLHLRGRECEVLVGEFDSEPSATLFAKELAKRFQVLAKPVPLPQ